MTEVNLGFAPANTVDEALRAFTGSQMPRDNVVRLDVERVARRDDEKWAKAHGVAPYSPEMMEQSWFPRYWWRVTAFLATLLFALTAAAQVTASFSPQPLAAFKAAFGAKLPGVAVFDVTVCSNLPTGIDVAAGRIVQAAHAQISTVNRSLVAATLAKARRSNARYRVARILEWATWVGGFLTAGGVMAVTPEIASIFPILAGASHRLADEFEGQVPAGGFEAQFLEGVLSLPPGGCVTRLLLGGYQRGQKPFTVEVR